MIDNYSIHIQTAHKYWKDLLLSSDNAIDATCGNGNDTLFLARLIKEGKIFAYDIQEKALENTLNLLKENHISLENIHLIHSSHENFSLNTDIKLIVYNLGYLPKGDKSVTTKVETTLKSIDNGLNLISEGGALSITCYSGHLEGEKEESAIIKMASALDSKKYSVCLHRWLNREKAPSLIWIKKF